MTGNQHISQEDLALHGMQALSEPESAQLQTHLAQCELCRDQLAELSGDAAMLGLSVPQHPAPAGARQRLLNRIAADSLAAKQESHGRILPFPRNTRIAWAIAAALAMIALTLYLKNNALNRELRDLSGQVAGLENKSVQARHVLDLLTARSAQHVLLTATKTSVEPAGRAVYLAESGSLIFQASNLKSVASDKAYELWLIPASGKPIPAGVFWPDAAGSASVVMPPLPKGVPAKAFCVTIENARGSDWPTTPIILSGAAASAAGE
jgi:anti-sigma-K factor RskA